MPIEEDKVFEEKLEQLCRMYRASRQIFEKVQTNNERAVAKWVVAGGRVIDMITALLAELESYSGCSDLRQILADLEAVRREREAAKEKA